VTRCGRVYFDRRLAGRIEEIPEGGMLFRYEREWLDDPAAPAISLTLQKREEPFLEALPFFMGLLPEGWLHALAIRKLRLQADDALGQILALCHDCIGAVHVEPDDADG